MAHEETLQVLLWQVRLRVAPKDCHKPQTPEMLSGLQVLQVAQLMNPNFNLPPGCTARDVETNGKPFVRYGRISRASGEPLSLDQFHKLMKHYDKVFGTRETVGQPSTTKTA